MHFLDNAWETPAEEARIAEEPGQYSFFDLYLFHFPRASE